MNKHMVGFVLATAVIAVAALPRGAAADCSPAHQTASTKSAEKNIVETAVAAGDFDTLVAAVKAAGLADVLSGEGPFTVFAPTDEAFAALPEGTVESLLKPENKDQLVAVLKYHVVSGKVYSEQALKAGKAETLQSASVNIRVQDGTPMVNDARLVQTDIKTSNGVIHVIDAVLLPPSDGAKASR